MAKSIHFLYAMGGGSSVSEVAERIELICTKIMKRCPDCKIALCKIYPVNREIKPLCVGIRDNHSIGKLNKEIECICKNYKAIELVDLEDLLTDEVGNLKEEYTYDGLHLRVQGYRAI